MTVVVDERMDVVVKEIKKDGRSPLLSLRCTVVNSDHPIDVNVLVNLQTQEGGIR